MEDKIFVVVPVYKVDAYLERCVDSILNQTYQNFELVLVDDGSPDHCPAICDRYAAEYENITVIHQENGGISAARNAGIDYAFQHGNPEQDWINFIDSDDFVHPKYLEYLYRAAKEAGVEISSCGNTRTSSSLIGFEAGTIFHYDCLNPEVYFAKNHTNAIVAWGKLYRLYLFEKIRYPIGKVFEDNFTTHRILFRQKKITVVWNRLYFWYENPSSITRSLWTPKQLDAMEALECQLSFFKENGYTKAYTASAKELFRHCVKQSISIRLMSPSYDHLISELGNRRKKAFALIVKELGLIPSAMYWFEIRIIKSIKRVLNNESIFSFIWRKLKKFLRAT